MIHRPGTSLERLTLDRDELLFEEGVEVGEGRGGGHCVTCPLLREA